MSYADSERLKWQVLLHAPERHDLGIAWYFAKKLAPDDLAEQQRLVTRAILDLFDEGLIFCSYASRDNGYTLDEDDLETVGRAEVELELARPHDYIEPEDNLFWFLTTKKGIEVLEALPPEAFLEPDPPPP